jgi:hypothetical protein
MVWIIVHIVANRDDGPTVALRTSILIAGLGLMLMLSYYGYWTVEERGEVVRKTLSWPWYAPVGSTIAFIWGYLLAGRKVQSGPRT